MLFKEKHIELIRLGEKTETRRVWKPNKHRPIPGNVYPAVTDFFTTREETDCWIRVPEEYERGYQEPLGEMTDEDAQREGAYQTVEEFKNEGWIPLHGEWDPRLLVDVVPLEYVGMSVYECPKCAERVGRKEGVRDRMTQTYWHGDCLEESRTGRTPPEDAGR